MSASAELMPRRSQPRGIFLSRYRRYHVCQSSRALLALVMSPGTSATTGALSVGNSAIASSSPADFAKRSINSDGASATTASSSLDDGVVVAVSPSAHAAGDADVDLLADGEQHGLPRCEVAFHPQQNLS